MTSEKMLNEAREQAAHCDRGAERLDYEATNAVEVLATRAGGDRIDPQEWAEQKRQAAGGARAYAEQLRTQAASGTVTQTGIDAGRLVAHAAEMGGWIGNVHRANRRELGALLRSGIFERREAEPGVAVARYELTTPQPATRPDAPGTASPREIAAAAQVAHGYPAAGGPTPTTPTPAARSSAPSTPSAARDQATQIG